MIPKGFIAITKHDSSSDPTVRFRTTYKECVDVVHNHFLSYDFEIKNGLPFDEGHYTQGSTRYTGHQCFDNVTLVDGKIASYCHCDGDGPIAYIEENE